MGTQAVTEDAVTSIYRGGHCSSGGLGYFALGQSDRSRIQILIFGLQVLHVFRPPLLAADKHQGKAYEANWSSDGACAGCFFLPKEAAQLLRDGSYLLLCKRSGLRLLAAGQQVSFLLVLSPSKSSLHKGAQMKSLMFCLVSVS